MPPKSSRRAVVQILGILAGVCSVVLLMACGSGSSSTGTATIIMVSASCSPSSIASQQTSTCTATVSGTGTYSQNVTWIASGGGTITALGGTFTAGTVPYTTQVTITATSTQDTTKTGSTTITVAAAGAVTSVSATCSPSQVQTGQLTACTATVNGTGSFSPNVNWTSSGGTINPITGLFSDISGGIFTITATSQQNSTVFGTTQVTVVTGVNNVLPIVVDSGPPGVSYVNGAFVNVTVCPPGTSTCQTIDHVLVDTGSIGLRLFAQGAAGGELSPTAFPLQTDSSGNPIAQCNQFIDGFTWGSVSLSTIQMAGETASTVPNATVAGVPIQIIGDPRVPAVPASCTGMTNESTVSSFGANGILGIGTFQQDCGSRCVSNSPIPTVYYSCASGTCNPTLQGLPQQVTNPVWVLLQDNNGTVVQLAPNLPSGGAATWSGSLIFGIGTQTNNGLGSATVFDVDSNGNFDTAFNGQTNSCSFIDSGSNAYFFPSSGYPGLVACTGAISGFYCPTINGQPTLLSSLQATNQSNVNTAQTGIVSFNVGNANTLFSNNNGNNTAFSELGGPNSAPSGCNGSFDWGLSFFYGKPNGVFTAIEQQPVTGTSYIGPFWAY